MSSTIRVVEWIHERWQQTGLSVGDLARRSGVSERTLYHIARRREKYSPSGATIRLLAAPLQLGPAAVVFLADRARGPDHLDPSDLQHLETLAGPVRRAPRGPA